MVSMMPSHFSEKPNSDTYLSDLNAAVFLQIAEILDINRTWERLLNILPGSHYSAQDVQRFENESTRNSASPTRSLLFDMGHRGFRVSDLIVFLEELQLERALIFLKPFRNLQHLKFNVNTDTVSKEPVSLLTPMKTEYTIEGGSNSSLEIECTAIGFPQPVYQWFKLNKTTDKDLWIELVNQCSRKLVIKPVRLEDKGKYNCRFNNFDPCTKEQSYAFTEVIKVFVKSEINRGNEFDVSHASMRTALEIKRHPTLTSRGPFYQGSTMVLTCIAAGSQPISYEWLKNGRKIPDEDSSTLNIVVQPEEDVVRFKYQCRVSNSDDCVLSDEVYVAVAPPRYGPQFLAEDKVALIIANDEYSEHVGLRSAVTDAITIAKLLRTLDFKVIAAINLDEEDMRNIVDEFCKLLDSGVYGVFYYAGHGFEVNKQCYMMPVDVASDYCCARCVCVEEVKSKMQNRNPALCCLMLDMCRKDPESNSIFASKGYRLYPTKVDRNVICVYATSYSCSALDGPKGKNGLFVKHLRNYITKELSIEVVLNHVFEDISVDPAASRRQFPSISEKTLAQTRRSLADRIHALLPNCDQRNEHYLSMIRKPSELMIRCESEDKSVLNVHVAFDLEEQVVCNVLAININVSDEKERPQNLFASCLTSLKPEYMCESLEQKAVEGQSFVGCKLRNLQKLKEPLMIQGKVYRINDAELEQEESSVWPETCLNHPLLSNVSRHWESSRTPEHCSSALEEDESGIGSFTSEQHAE